jgi:3',5'-cyclic-AMP phosphodiesterase
MTLKILQFTDTHLFANNDGRLMGVDTYSTCQQVMEVAKEQEESPDLVLLTGDLSQDETPASYERLAELVQNFKVPVYFLPGNHDQVDLMIEAFGKQPMFKAERAIELDSWQIVLLDSTVPNEVGGHLRADQLELLDRALSANPDKHALIALHHHPLPIGSAWIDQIPADNGQEFFKVVDRHPQVRMVLWGHVHQEYESERNGVLLRATPSTCVQFLPGSESFGLDKRMPGYRWIRLDGDGMITTGVERLPDGPIGLDPQANGY